MEKSRIRFVCQNCGYISSKWLGRCPECGQWDSFYEENLKKESFVRGLSSEVASPLPRMWSVG